MPLRWVRCRSNRIKKARVIVPRTGLCRTVIRPRFRPTNFRVTLRLSYEPNRVNRSFCCRVRRRVGARLPTDRVKPGVTVILFLIFVVLPSRFVKKSIL